MPKRMCRSDVDSNLIAKRLQHVPVDVSHYQWSAVSAFEETTALTIADMLLQHRHHVWMDVDVSVTGLSFGSRLLMMVDAPSNVALRVNIPETSLVPLINEQKGEKEADRDD